MKGLPVCARALVAVWGGWWLWVVWRGWVACASLPSRWRRRCLHRCAALRLRSDRQLAVVGGVQSGRGAARDRQRRHRVGVLGVRGRRAVSGERLSVCDRPLPAVGGVQSGRTAARDRQLLRRHGVDVLGVRGRRAIAGERLSGCHGRLPGVGGVQSGRGAARDRQRARRHGVGVLGVRGRRAITGQAALRLRPAAPRSRWRSVRAGGCSRPPTRDSTTARCRCSRCPRAARYRR